MAKTVKIISFFILSICCSHYAAATDIQLPDLNELGNFKWQHTDLDMSGYSYEKATKYNKRILRRAIKDYIETKFSAMGVPRPALTLTGAAVLYAAGKDAKFSLNDSKTMSIELKDMRDEDRAILYKMKFSW